MSANSAGERDPYGAFSDHFDQLVADAQKYQEAAEAEQKAKEAYNKRFAEIEGMAKDGMSPDKLMMMIIMLLCEEGSRQMDSGLGTHAAALKIQGDLTQCGNDIEKLTNMVSLKDKDLTGDQGVLAWVARDEDKLLDVLDPSITSGVNGNIQAALGGDGAAASALFSQCKVIRGDIMFEDDENKKYNPDPKDFPDQKPPYSYHFDVKGNGYMASYYEMNQNMQSAGDKGQGTEAAKLKTDAFNQNNSTTQSVGAAAQQKITLDSNTIKTVQSFTTSMMADWIKRMSASNQAMTKASS